MMGYGDGMMGGWNGYGMMGGGSPLWGLLMLIFVVAAIAAVALFAVWLIRRGPSAPGGAVRGGQEAGEILRRRFASGDIDDEEFRRRLAIMEGH